MTQKPDGIEEFTARLREAEVLIGQGKAVCDVTKAIGISEVVFYRCRREIVVLNVSQAKQVKESARHTQEPSIRQRLWVDLGLLLLATAIALTVAIQMHGPVRTLTVVFGACLIPGGAVFTLLPRPETCVTYVSLSVALSMTLELVGASAMAALSFWHPCGFAGLLGAGACVLIVADAVRCLRARTRPAIQP